MNNNYGVKEFDKSIVKYFMDFIETDFHKRSAPKKRIVYTNSDNLVVGCNLSKFNKISDKISKLLNNSLDSKLSVKKGDYNCILSNTLIVKAKELFRITCESNIKKISLKFIKNVEEYLKNKDLVSSKSALKDELIQNIKLITKDSVTKKYFTENYNFFISKGVKEEEIISLEDSFESIILSNFDDDITELIEKCYSNNNIKAKEVASFITYEKFESILDEFLENFSVNNLFLELSKMNSSKRLLENQELYLSLFDITYDKNKYPLFYIPFSLKEGKDEFQIEFGSQMYINKKAIEYIIQELKNETVLIGKIASITERIIYLSDCQPPANKIMQIMSDIMVFFSFKDSFDNNFSKIISYKNEFVTISNNMYFNIYDISDDALVNDYEELLQELNLDESKIAEFFESLISEFMTKDPESINKEIEDEWEENEIEEKLVYPAPVPLNEEQIKILKAIEKEKCKYVTVQGPPGTGKSHTITAIIFDLILKNKSVLVLSDKKEALDVVEDKITSTLNEVRLDSDFQNPVLRLGKSGGTYSKILSKSSIENIKVSYKVAKSKQTQIDNKIEKLINTIKEDIKFEKSNYEKIKLEDILEYENLNKKLHDLQNNCVDEFKNTSSIIEDLDNIINILELFGNQDILKRYINILNIYKMQDENLCYIESNFSKIESIILNYNKYVNYVRREYENSDSIIIKYKDININEFEVLKKYIKEYKSFNNFINRIFNKDKLSEYTRKIKHIYNEFVPNEKSEINSFEVLFEIYDYINSEGIKDEIDFEIYKNIIIDNKINDNLQLIRNYKENINILLKNKEKYKNILSELTEKNVFEDHSKLFDLLCDYLRLFTLKDELESIFGEIPISNYLAYKNEMQSLITTKTAMIMDDRVINFYENNSNSAMTLKKIIQSKRKFPKNDFDKLKNAFPCILAGIRDYAEYIPLELNMFDLVIIDEASQVSIAQALPALIRAKKVLVLGDKKQFSNVKSNQAKTEINNEYKNSIKRCFEQSEYSNITTSTKLDYFDIKSSVLEFFEHISNYQAMLFKYFRGYDAIISYSNKFFYQGKLQVMKIRGKNINEVLKFDLLKHDDLLEAVPKTNMIECNFIKEKLLELLNEGYKGSVGVITPHTNQQKLIFNVIHNLPEYYDLKNKFNLKVMTFDSCQGEERDIIFYSMVATIKDDKLYGIFPKSLANIDLEEDGNLRAQRLNVGFSRAKECMHFVLSKDVSLFNGEIGTALKFYKNYLETAKKEKSIELTDKNSPQESLVMKYFYETDFWKENHENIEFLPQFELGKYLKQLDSAYIHPLYCVDFLLLYNNNGKTQKIVIEYDGFKEHFEDLLNVDKDNYNNYYKDEDIYRQKVLESYGYKFLRINKFNIGDNPVKELNNRLYSIIKSEETFKNTFRYSLFKDVRGIKEKTKKECPKCKRILDIADFKDDSLIAGYGRICNSCKSKNQSISHKHSTFSSGHMCPWCGARLIVRRGRYGRFKGCSRYPYCKYTENL